MASVQQWVPSGSPALLVRPGDKTTTSKSAAVAAASSGSDSDTASSTSVDSQQSQTQFKQQQLHEQQQSSIKVSSPLSSAVATTMSSSDTESDEAVGSQQQQQQQHPVGKFIDMMDELSWRSKVLKNIQYTGKLVYWYLEYTERTGQGYKQIKSLASALSLVRRFMQFLDWLDSLRDLAQAIRKRDAFGAVQAAIAATNEVCDDLVTLRKAGAISARAIPFDAERISDVFWCISTIINLFKAGRQLHAAHTAVAAHDKAQQQQQQQLAISSSSSPSSSSLDKAATPSASMRLAQSGALSPSGGRAAGTGGSRALVPASPTRSPSSTRARLSVKRTLAWVSFLKLVADSGQAVPGALDLDEYPDIADHLSGWLSGWLSTYKLWVKHDS